jgi:hypothetical protein
MEKKVLTIGSGLLTSISIYSYIKEKHTNKKSKILLYNLLSSSSIVFSYSLFKFVKK